jgi:hypothetical protein
MYSFAFLVEFWMSSEVAGDVVLQATKKKTHDTPSVCQILCGPLDR